MDNFNTGLVSVIIPFFNDSEWLLEALESVVNQDYTNWEAIVVDDGSEHHHSRIAKAYCMKYPGKMIYTEHDDHINRGVTISRNVGVALASGSFLAFLDADDKWLPGKLKGQVDLFRQFPDAQMICEASLFWYSWNDATAEDNIIQVGVEPDILYLPRALTKNLYPLGEGAPPCPCAIIIRKPAFDRSGGFEPAFSGLYQLYEDQAFLAKVYLKEPVYISGLANNLYRKRENSMSSGINNKANYEKVRKFFLRWLEAYLGKQKIEDHEITALIHHAFSNMEP